MVDNYAILIGAVVHETKGGAWGAKLLPKDRNWEVEFSEKKNWKNSLRLQAMALVCALRDLMIPCDILVVSDDEAFLGAVEEISGGLVSPALTEAINDVLYDEIKRHKTIAVRSVKDSPYAKKYATMQKELTALIRARS